MLEEIHGRAAFFTFSTQYNTDRFENIAFNSSFDCVTCYNALLPSDGRRVYVGSC
jgi:hypothetical protein